MRHTLPLAAALTLLCPPLLADPVTPADIADMANMAGMRPMVTIDVDDATGHAFDPRDALGAGVDGAGSGEADRLLTAHNIAAMRSAGLTSLTYRLRTELGIEAWHWNPRGTWSDTAHAQGYWTSSDRPGAPIRLSYGYALPRRGDTLDNANNTGWSRLTDGDEGTFWKSNPYLDAGYLRDGRAHPQWLVLRLDQAAMVDTVRIAWADPYAVRYEVQYWTGAEEYTKGAHWVTFPHGLVSAGTGGTALLHVADTPVSTRFVRVVMRAGSGTAPPDAQDWRDRAGFAVREVGLGTIQADGAFHDVVHHVPAHDGQTFAHVSSTDPWHRATDRDMGVEQIGLDRIFASGLANGRPVLLPVGVMYDTPDNAVAEMRYLRRRGYLVRQVELGEEPDGQFGEAEDYGALYLALVDRLRVVAPGVAWGGPSAQDAFTGTWMNDDPDTSWNSHFIAYLRARGRLSDLQFYSTEHYPFDDICGDIHARLIEQTRQMDTLFARLVGEGVPRGIPWIISEYGFSAYSGRAMAQMPSALLMANIIGQFLNTGGSTAYLFGYGPNVPINQHQACAGYGNMMLHMADGAGQAAMPMPSYHTARMIADGWLMARGTHRMVPSAVAGMPGDMVRAYGVRRPDGRVALLLINRDPARAYAVDLRARGRDGRLSPWQGGQVLQFGPAQYAWVDAGPASHPARSDPARRFRLAPGATSVSVPADSVTVVVAANQG